MRHFSIYAACASLLLALAALDAGIVDVHPASGSVRDSSNAFAATGAAPTHVSDLAPAVVLPFDEPNPSAAPRQDASLPWVPIAGTALALLGVLLVHGGLSSQQDRWGSQRAAS